MEETSKRMKKRGKKATCLPYADDSVGDEDKQDDKRLNKCRNLIFRLLKPRQYLQHALTRSHQSTALIQFNTEFV